MAINLSDQNWDELWAEGVQNGEILVESDGVETIARGFPKQLGKGYIQTIQLRAGLFLRIYDLESSEDLIVTAHNPTNSDACLSFFVVGNDRSTLHNLVGEVEECAGRNYVSCPRGVKETEEWQAGQRLLRIQVCIPSVEFFKTFGIVQPNQLPDGLRRMVEQEQMQPYYHQGITTPDMQIVLQQILNCPHQDMRKCIYLESKALELLTLQFAQLAEGNDIAKPAIVLRPDDIERLHQIKEILLRNLDQPPSLLDLARQVEMNDNKLKQGSRQTFGITVFGYLHQQRLEQARHLLARNWNLDGCGGGSEGRVCRSQPFCSGIL